MMRVSPEDLIVVYKNSSTKEPAYKIRLYDIDTEDTKKTTHYAEVYSPRTNPNCSESLANYASLCVGHPELIDILAEDYPEIVTALRGCVEAMLKEVPK